MKTINTKQKSLPTSYGTKREEKVCFSMNVKKGISKGFTLVELIIVITILAILATIAFISFKNYSGNARDGNRIATLKTIETGIELYTLKTGTPPSPEGEMIQIMGSGTTASGTLLWTKGKLGETISKQIKMNKTPFDPYTQTAYIYASTPNGEYQIGTTLENFQATIFTPVAYANQSQAKVVGNYKARFFETETMRYFIPSLIFTGTGINGEIRLFDTPSPTLYYVTDRDTNLPYPLGTTVSENKEMKDLELVKDIIEKVKDQLDDEEDKTKVDNYFTPTGTEKPEGSEIDTIYKTIKETTGSSPSNPPSPLTPPSSTSVSKTQCEDAGWGWVEDNTTGEGDGFCISPRVTGGNEYISWMDIGTWYNWARNSLKPMVGSANNGWGVTYDLGNYSCEEIGYVEGDTLYNRMKWISTHQTGALNDIDWVTVPDKPESLSVPAIMLADCIDGKRDLDDNDGKTLGGVTYEQYSNPTDDTAGRQNMNKYLLGWTKQKGSHLPSGYSSIDDEINSSNTTGEYQVACNYFTTGTGATGTGSGTSNVAFSTNQGYRTWLASIGTTSGSDWGYTARVAGGTGCASQSYGYAGYRPSYVSARFVVR